MINSNTKNSSGLDTIKQMSSEDRHIKQFYAIISQSVDNIIKKSQQEILKHQALFKNNLPAKCFKHDNILTLYCQKQRIPLCVSCIYYANDHKSHNIIPLKNATRQILIDSKNLENKLQRNIEWIEKIISKSTDNLTNMTKIFPQVKNKIHKNFKSLYNVLVQKEQQQLQRLYCLTDQINKQHIVLIEEYNRLLCFLVKQKNSIQNTKITLPLHKRNTLFQIFQQLKLPDINITKIQYQTIGNAFNSHIFKEIQNYLAEKLIRKEFCKIIRIGSPKANTLTVCNREQNLQYDKSTQKYNENKLSLFLNEVAQHQYQYLKNSNVSRKSRSPTFKSRYNNQLFTQKRIIKTPRNPISPKKFFE